MPGVARVEDVTTLIAEDLLLLLLDDEKGTPTSSSLDTALGGALLLELALLDAVHVRERTSIWSSAKVAVTPGDRAIEDPVLASARDRVAERERAASDLVTHLGKGARQALADRLVQRGLLTRRDDRVLGLFPRTRWLATDDPHETRVRAALTAVLVQGLQPDARTGALVALLSAVDAAPSAVDHTGVPAREIRRRAKQIAEGTWAAKAVQDAIAAAMAAVLAATTAATTVAVTSS